MKIFNSAHLIYSEKRQLELLLSEVKTLQKPLVTFASLKLYNVFSFERLGSVMHNSNLQWNVQSTDDHIGFLHFIAFLIIYFKSVIFLAFVAITNRTLKNLANNLHIMVQVVCVRRRGGRTICECVLFVLLWVCVSSQSTESVRGVLYFPKHNIYWSGI